MYNNIRNIHELYDTEGNPLQEKASMFIGKSASFALPTELTNKIRLTFLDKSPPELRLYGVVDDEMAHYVRESLMFLESKDEQPAVKVTITSPGGSVVAGLEIYSLLSQYRGGTKGFVDGYAYSAAAQLILQGCLVRTANKYSRLMSHFAHTMVYVGEHDLGGKRRMERVFDELKTCNDQAVDIIMGRTGKEERAVRKFLKQGLYKTAQEYKEFGLIDSYYSMKVTQTKDGKGNTINQSNLFVE